MTTLTFPARRARIAVRGSQAAAALIVGVGHVIGWAGRRAPALPGLAGAGGLSVACGGLVQAFAGTGGVWAGVGLASVFLLVIDRRITLR